MEKPFNTYLFEYEFDGERWALEITASSEKEAVARVRCLSSQALYLGRVVSEVPAVFGLGWLLTIYCAIRNWFQ